MKIKSSPSEKAFDVFNILFMILLSIAALYPLLHVFFASLSSSDLLMAHKGLIVWPMGFQLDAYVKVLNYRMIMTGYLNTIIVVVFGVMINLVMTTFGAYFLSRKNIMFRNEVMFLVVFTMFFSGGLIPFYFTVKNLHLDNSLWALLIPTAINTFNMIIMRTTFLAVPESLEESAFLDGANDFTVLFRIILPLSMPVVAVMILYYAVERWNSWFYAMVFLRDRSLYPLQLILREILIQNDTSSMTGTVSAGDEQAIAETVKYAVVIIATVPILMIYPFLQKYFVKGVMIGAVKG